MRDFDRLYVIVNLIVWLHQIMSSLAIVSVAILVWIFVMELLFLEGGLQVLEVLPSQAVNAHVDICFAYSNKHEDFAFFSAAVCL